MLKKMCVILILEEILMRHQVHLSDLCKIVHVGKNSKYNCMHGLMKVLYFQIIMGQIFRVFHVLL